MERTSELVIIIPKIIKDVKDLVAMISTGTDYQDEKRCMKEILELIEYKKEYNELMSPTPKTKH